MEKDICFTEMQAIQKELQARYPQWGGLSSAKGKDTLLYLMIEAGEAADILKKEGQEAVDDDPEIRAHFVEELCDVMMFFNDLLLCYNITPEELSQAYREKHKRNMTRW